MEKLCIFCKHYYFDAGCPGYSEYTPGWTTEEGCRKQHWETDMFEDCEDIRRSNFLKAETCLDYIFFKDTENSK